MASYTKQAKDESLQHPAMRARAIRAGAVARRRRLSLRWRAMTRAPVHAADFPPYPFDEPCRRCRRRGPQMVSFDRDCGEVIGDHYHRECIACGARWLEQCARSRRA
jgi:hypothetical protein